MEVKIDESGLTVAQLFGKETVQTDCMDLH